MRGNLSSRTQAINAAKATIGELLTEYARAKDPTKGAAARTQVLAKLHEVLVTPEEATAKYRQRCESFLETVIAVRGIPFREIGSDDDAPLGSNSGGWVAEHFDELLPEIQRQLEVCVERFNVYAQAACQQYQDDFVALLEGFLREPPRLAKDIGPRITPIKREAGDYARWDRVTGVLTNISFLNEIDFLFHHRSGEYVAAQWDYSKLDEQQDHLPASDHKDRDGVVYTVANNWALQKGLMTVGSAGYIEDIDIPARQLGCMCHLRWISSVSELPEEMRTAIGRERAGPARERIQRREKRSWISRLFPHLRGR